MAGVNRSNPDRDGTLDFEGFLNNLQDWDSSFKDKEKKSRGQVRKDKQGVTSLNMGKEAESMGLPRKVPATGGKKQIHTVSEVPFKSNGEAYNYFRSSDTISRISGNLLDEENSPTATSEKELGNEYFKQKNFLKAIECYSRSIALSPTSVAFANRAMAYLKIKRFEEAENDCTEALNLDDRYVKAYSRRATARKELGKLKSSIEDSDFALRLEPNNQELRKLYTETKALYEKELDKKISGAVKNPIQGVQEVEYSSVALEGDASGIQSISSNSQSAASIAIRTSSEKIHDVHKKHELKPSVQELASRAASRVMMTAQKNIAPPKSAYEFEVSWRHLSNDSSLQARLLKTIQPSSLPQLFKNALSATMLIEIARCTATFFREETALAVSILDNLNKVSRFDMIVMCLPAVDHADLHKIWDDVFFSKDIASEHAETLGKLRPKYCPGGSQAHSLEFNGWPR